MSYFFKFKIYKSPFGVAKALKVWSTKSLERLECSEFLNDLSTSNKFEVDPII